MTIDNILDERILFKRETALECPTDTRGENYENNLCAHFGNKHRQLFIFVGGTRRVTISINSQQ